MPIPTFDECFRPFLVALGKHPSLHMNDLRAAVAAEFKLTPMEIAQRLPSGKFTVIANRMGWARTYLSKIDRNSLFQRRGRAPDKSTVKR